MGWITVFVTIPALVMLGFMLWRLEGEGLRERLEHDGPRT